MRYRLYHVLIPLLVGTGCASAVFAQPTKPATSAPTTATTAHAGLEKLIEQLGSGDWKVRDAAQTVIIALGASVRDRISQVAKDTDDPEVRQRAQDILQQ